MPARHGHPARTEIADRHAFRHPRFRLHAQAGEDAGDKLLQMDDGWLRRQGRIARQSRQQSGMGLQDRDAARTHAAPGRQAAQQHGGVRGLPVADQQVGRKRRAPAQPAPGDAGHQRMGLGFRAHDGTRPGLETVARQLLRRQGQQQGGAARRDLAPHLLHRRRAAAGADHQQVPGRGSSSRRNPALCPERGRPVDVKKEEGP